MNKLKLVDIRSVTRNSDKCVTKVLILARSETSLWPKREEWVICSQSILRREERAESDRWILKSYLDGGYTDFDHDSAYALSLPLIGIRFIGIEYGVTEVRGWIDPNDSEGFRVPPPGYNPAKLPGLIKCKECKPGHPFIPDGYWYPPFNKDLYKLVAGKEVSIQIGFPVNG